MRGLAGNAIVVCGGASGIGRACALALAEAGCRVTIGDRDEKGGRAVVAEIEERGGEALFVPCDATSEADAARLVAAAQARFGAVRGLCYSVGVTTVRKPVKDMALAEWQRAIDVNLTGAFLAIKHQLPAIEQAGGGAIVLIASMAAMKGTPLASDYCASKSGMLGLMRAVSIEAAGAGVRVNVVMPGATWTPMLEGATSPQHSAGLMARTPIGRIAEPREIAETVRWLLSDEASYVTGASLAADGGMSAL